jgi:hypothetical protein
MGEPTIRAAGDHAPNPDIQPGQIWAKHLKMHRLLRQEGFRGCVGIRPGVYAAQKLKYQ